MQYSNIAIDGSLYYFLLLLLFSFISFLVQILSSLNENESSRLEILPEAHAHLWVTPLRFRALSFSPPQCELTNTLRRSSITGLLSSFLLLCREYHVFRCHFQTSIHGKKQQFYLPHWWLSATSFKWDLWNVMRFEVVQRFWELEVLIGVLQENTAMWLFSHLRACKE